MSRVLELYTCCTYVSVVSFFRGCTMASAERRERKRSTNMPKGGPPLAASNTSAVLRFLPKGSHAVAGRLNGPPSTSKVVVALLWWHPPWGCHVSRFTTTTTTTITFRVMSPASGPESGEERCRCTNRELVFRRHTRTSHLALSARSGFRRVSNGDGRPCTERSQVSRERSLNAAVRYSFFFAGFVLFLSFLFVFFSMLCIFCA